MSHNSTIFGQILKMIPRHEFEVLANQHHSGRRFRKASRWSQFVAMTMAQLSGRSSLRDIISNLSVQTHRLYHLGSAMLSRSNLARINEDKPCTLYEALFGKLLRRCQPKAPGHGFRFKNKLYSLDASTIDLCLNLFPWANFRTTKGAVKLHVGLDHQGYLPTFLTISDGQTTDIEAGRVMDFPKHSIVVCDRAYNDYTWYKHLTDKGIYFVTRLKKNAKYRVIKRLDVANKKNICSDQVIEFTGIQAHKKCPIRMRRVGYYRDPETKKHYVF